MIMGEGIIISTPPGAPRRSTAYVDRREPNHRGGRENIEA
jgi:hypothetical protein